MPRPRPASNRRWRERWDELSSALVEELERPDCDVGRVTELVRDRRRLTTAAPTNQPGDPLISEDEERAWLERALDRERVVSELAHRVQDRIERSLISLKAGRRVRDHFDDGEARPKVFSTRL